MKRLVENFFLVGVVSITTFTFSYSDQVKTVIFAQGNKVGVQLIYFLYLKFYFKI